MLYYIEHERNVREKEEKKKVKFMFSNEEWSIICDKQIGVIQKEKKNDRSLDYTNKKIWSRTRED